ncbi:MAG: PAS domain S-box protein, partial [Acidobacteriota bacterium]
MSTTEPKAPEQPAEEPPAAVDESAEARRRVLPRWVAPTVLLLAFVPSLGALALRLVGFDGVWSASVEFLRPSAHGVVEWTSALVALAAGLLAYVRWRGTGEDELETVTLAFALPAVAVLDALHALLPWTVAEARFGLLLDLTWNASRWFLALSLAVGLAMAWSALRSRDRQGGRAGIRVLSLVPASIACLVFVGAGWLAQGLRTDSELQPTVRPWELGPLVLLLLAACLWAPDVVRLRGSVLSHCLKLAFVPLIFCQLEMLLGSLVLGHWQKLLAYAVLAGGGLGEIAVMMRRQESARRSRHDVEVELRAKMEELERLEDQRRAQAEKRREAEHSLRMLAKAVETMSLGVTITDMDGTILYVNPADARIHGYTVDELHGQDSRIYAAGDAIEGGGDVVEPWARERMNRTRSGEIFPVRLVSDRVRDRDGQPIATVTICEDIRERIRIREALERRDRILEAVAFAAERFLSQSEWETSISDVLERLGEATGVDRVYLDLINEAYPFGIEDFTYYWSALGDVDARLTEGYSTNRVELVDRWEAALREGTVLSGRVSDLPIEEQPVFSRRGVRSFALVP